MKNYIAGFEYKNGFYRCLYCGCAFERGVVYREGDAFYDAEKAAERHIAAAHGSPFEALLTLDKKQSGLSDTQREFLRHFYAGTPDADIAKQTGSSPSTVRFQRYSFREKVRQARVILALGELLEARHETPVFPTVHPSATQVDERYMTDDAEQKKVLQTYFTSFDPPLLTRLPPKEKKKLVILRYIAGRFERDKKYNEKEINAVLKPIHSDYVTIRRYLIEYGFMDRTPDGSEYWLK